MAFLQIRHGDIFLGVFGLKIYKKVLSMISNLQRFIHKPIAFVFCIYALSSLAQAQGQSQAIRTLERDGVIARITPLSAPYEITSSGVGMDQSRVIFYRPINSGGNSVNASNAASVFVEKMYHASLIPGGYSSLCFRPGVTELGLREVKVGSPPKDGQENILITDLARGQTQYIRVGDSNPRRWALESVSNEVANRELLSTKLEVQTISRVIGAQECQFNQKLQLAGDTLFKFDQSNQAGLTGAGSAALDQLVQKLNSDYKTISAISVTGYADPLGKAARNEKLSVERAKTVLAYLQSKGVNAPQMLSQGMGSQDLVVSNCEKVTNQKSIACNQPNRRVVIDVTGKTN